MKIRTAFISNSSSTSFLLMTTLENHERALSKLTPEEQEELEEIFNFDKFAGLDIVTMSRFSDRGGDSYINGLTYTDELDTAFSNYKNEIKICPKLVFENQEDW